MSLKPAFKRFEHTFSRYKPYLLVKKNKLYPKWKISIRYFNCRRDIDVAVDVTALCV